MNTIDPTFPTTPGTTQPASISTLPAGLPPGLPMTLDDGGLTSTQPPPLDTSSTLESTLPPQDMFGTAPIDPQLLQESTAAPTAWYAPPGFGENFMSMSQVEVYVILIAIALAVISTSLIVSLSK